MRRKYFLAANFVLIVAGLVLMTGVSAWASNTLTVLHNFDNSGNSPVGNLIFDSVGNIYGTAVSGGLVSPNCPSNCGAVFELSPSGGSWTYKTLYSFTGGADGGEPHGRLMLDSKGNLYGTTYVGGTAGGACSAGCGTVFELSPSGGSWNLTLLHSFSGPDGFSPWTGLTVGSSGNLYGTTSSGGSGGAGTVFELSSSGGGWTFSTVYALTGSGSEGEFPFSDLVVDAAGNIYGAAQQGGSSKSNCSNHCGTVFELSPSGGTWKFSLLHSFMGVKLGATYGDGGIPWGSLTLDKAGNLFGTTFEGGKTCNSCGGTVFKISQSAGKWKTQILHRFTGLDGLAPLGGVTLDKAGNLYGTTELGGSNGEGTVFRLTPAPKGGWKFTSLYSFTGQADGGQPYAGVVADASGNLYGATNAALPPLEGAVFELSIH